MRKLIIILGPTASGKSALGVRLAKKFHGVVISADSRQVYRGLDLGTGKITKREMRGISHYLLDVASPRGQYAVNRYVRDVHRVLKKIPPKTLIFLVGGSPFYIDALTKPNTYSPVPPNPALRRRLEKISTSRLIGQLHRLAPQRLSTIDTANHRRLIRAIEIATVTTPPARGGAASRFPTPGGITRTGAVGELPQFRILKIGLSVPKAKLHRNIDRRVDQRMRQGMLNEVRRLHHQGVSWSRLDAFGLEYRYLGKILRGTLTRTDAIDKLKSATHDFAKRQMTWWKRDQSIHWVTPTQATPIVKRFLRPQ